MAADRQAKRSRACREASALLAGGATWKEAAVAVDVALGTLERWMRKWRAEGEDGLLDKYDAVGRKALADCLDQASIDFIRRKTAKCGSMALTYQFLWMIRCALMLCGSI